MRLLPLGDGAGAVVYRVRAQREGSAPYLALVSSVSMEEGGAWKLALHRQTPL